MDEYDALLEEPFGEDIDWATIDSISLAPFFPPSTVTIPRSNSNLTNGSALSNDDIIIISSSSPYKTTSATLYSSPIKSKESYVKETLPTKNRTSSEPHRCQCESRKPIKKRKYLQAIEDILECTICFNVIAAAHSLTCGHIACGLCLIECLKSDGNCFVCREPANGVFVPNFQIDRLAELYFKNKPDMNETEREDYRQWQIRLEAGRSKMQARRSKRSKSKKSTAQNPPRDRDREGRHQRNSTVVTNFNQPPPYDPARDPHTIRLQPIEPPPPDPVAIPPNPPPVNHPHRTRRQRHPTVSAPIIIRPEIITEEIVHVIPYDATV